MKDLNEWKAEPHGPLVQIAAPVAKTAANLRAGELQGVSGD